MILDNYVTDTGRQENKIEHGLDLVISISRLILQSVEIYSTAE